MSTTDETPDATKPDSKLPVRPQLSLWDTVSVIVGIVIGASVYETPPLILSNVPTPWIGLGVWALGGLLSLIGAFVYAELATTYPRQGGDYVYLTRAFGPWAGFLFGWAQLSVVRCGSIGMMSFVFSHYAAKLWGLSDSGAFLVAALAVVTLSVINLLGVQVGRRTQNVLTATKVLGLSGILVAGFCWGNAANLYAEPSSVQGPGLGLAIILVLYAFGGWNDAAFVAAELRERRNIARSLILGIAAISVIYLAVNAAYIFGLGFEGVRASKSVAADVLALPFGEDGVKASNAMCLLVMISALGAVHGMIFTGSRVYATLGEDHRVFALLGHWHPRLGSPHWALLAQTLFTLFMMLLAAGFQKGPVDAVVQALHLPPINWEMHRGGFDTLLAATAPVFWAFFLLTGLAYFVLRDRLVGHERPFALTVPWFPVLPLIFCLTCGYMFYAAVEWAGSLAVLGATPLLLAVPLYVLSQNLPGKRNDLDDPALSRASLG